MALATEADVEAALKRSLSGDESDSVAIDLESASDLVLGYLNCELPDPTPGAVVRVVADIVAALYSSAASMPQNVDSLAAGPYSMRFTDGSTSKRPWLTAALRQRLRPYRSGVVSVPLSSEGYA